MKVFRLLATLGIALSCVLAPSCSKESDSEYESTIWTGSYPTQMLNNDTGKTEDHTATISLQFSNFGQKCIVERGIAGLFANNRLIYDANWSSKSNFALFKSEDAQDSPQYKGTIKRNKMTLVFMNSDKVKNTIELEKVKLN